MSPKSSMIHLDIFYNGFDYIGGVSVQKVWVSSDHNTMQTVALTVVLMTLQFKLLYHNASKQIAVIDSMSTYP